MEVVASILVVTSLAAALATAALRPHLPGRWRRTAAHLGFEMTRTRGRYELTGSLHGIEVTVTQTSMSIFISLQGKTPLDEAVRLSPQWIEPGSGELQLGEREFDQAFYLQGRDDAVAAVLTEEARESMQALSPHPIEVDRGALRVVLPSHAAPSEASFVRAIERSVALYRALRGRGQTVPERLLENALHDRVPAVRDTNLRLLLTHHGDTDAGQRGRELAERSRDPNLRILAVRSSGHGAAEALAGMMRDPYLDERYQLQALDAAKTLGTAFDRELGPLLSQTREAVEAALAEWIAERQLDSLYPLLLARAERARGPAAIGYCRAFARWRRAGAEPHLIAFLTDDSAEVQAEAAKALARVGSVRAVQPLLELTTGILRPSAVKAAARTAVAMIQSRLQGAEVGDLSLASPHDDAGELSLPAGADGRPQG